MVISADPGPFGILSDAPYAARRLRCQPDRVRVFIGLRGALVSFERRNFRLARHSHLGDVGS